ncbi:MAG: TAXI family TRAP transporter solute-binding subunit [Candidatus Rokubacteria bacterium]|nr:TAXI family TRAP transporter solute-binding subunit [Candidatus Rokubacteria bacterium]
MRAARSIVLAAFLASASASCVAPALNGDRAPLTIATGGPGGVYHPVGNAICRIFNLAEEGSTARCVTRLSEGSVANVRRVRRGEAALGLSQSDVAYAAYRGEGPFTAVGPDTELRTVIALHPEALAVIARADAGIRRFEDLRGKRISVGRSGASSVVAHDDLLAAYGWTASDFARSLSLGLAEQNRALCGGSVDAIVFQAAQPSGFIQEATIGCPARLLHLEGPAIGRLLAAHPYYVASVIPGGMYDGNPNDIPTFGTRVLLVTSAREPEDLVYAVVKAVFENFADFRRLHPALFTLKPSDLVPGGGVMPIHPGAAKYYRDAGLSR